MQKNSSFASQDKNGQQETSTYQVLGEAYINGVNQRRESMKQSSEEYLRRSREIERDNRVINTDCTTDRTGDVHCQSH